MRRTCGSGRSSITVVDQPPQETYNPWTVVNLVFHHLADQGLHPTFGAAGDPGAHAAALLEALGIHPAPEGDSQKSEQVRDELAKIRAAFFGEA